MCAMSHEVRWFLPGALPVAVRGWFLEGAGFGSGRPDEAEPRVDRYFVLPDVDEIAFKWRGGGDGDARFEVKGRLLELGERSFARNVIGRVERWVKWSMAETGFGPIARCLAVRKARVTRLAALRPGGTVEPVDAGPAAPVLARGIQAEVTGLELDGRVHWSVAFEAFGDDEAMASDFASAVQRGFRGWPGPALIADESMGYAGWLGLQGRVE